MLVCVLGWLMAMQHLRAPLGKTCVSMVSSHSAKTWQGLFVPCAERPTCMSQVVQRQPEDSPVVAALYGSVLGQALGSEAARALFHTQYHRREKTLAAAAGDW